MSLVEKRMSTVYPPRARGPAAGRLFGCPVKARGRRHRLTNRLTRSGRRAIPSARHFGTRCKLTVAPIRRVRRIWSSRPRRALRTPLRDKNLYNQELALACAGIKQPRISWHSFRHNHATLLNNNGESLQTQACFPLIETVQRELRWTVTDKDLSEKMTRVAQM